MTIFPAVDIRYGQAVRLRQGRKEDMTVFDADPLKMARQWRDQGARWLHVIDLDGAFDGNRTNAALIGRICGELDIPVQVGGGIRTIEDAVAYLDAGVTRVIIGTTALEQPDVFAAMCVSFPGKVGVSLDAEKGKLKTRGWLADSGLEIADVLPRLEASGAAFIIYTDIERDGMHSGINLQAFEKLLQTTSLPVIAAGGITNMDDVKNIYALKKYKNLEGMITGRALYEKTLNLAEALVWLEGEE